MGGGADAREAKPTERGEGVVGGPAPFHNRSLRNLTLEIVHSGGF